MADTKHELINLLRGYAHGQTSCFWYRCRQGFIRSLPPVHKISRNGFKHKRKQLIGHNYQENDMSFIQLKTQTLKRLVSLDKTHIVTTLPLLSCFTLCRHNNHNTYWNVPVESKSRAMINNNSFFRFKEG